MAATLTIPLNTLTVGTHEFGPASITDDLTTAVLTIDRTVSRPNAEGFNAQPATTRVDMAIEESDDGGTTWGLRAAAGIIGGTYINPRTGTPFLFSDVTVELNQATGRRVRATIVVTGARVVVAGTLVMT